MANQYQQHGYVVNVDGAVVRDGDYLVIERGGDESHAAGVLGFPGGTLEADPGQSGAIERTARRELREEVGLEVGSVEYVHSSTFETDDGVRCLNVLARCEDEGGEARPRASDEVAAVHWLTPDELAARRDAPAFLLDYVEVLEAFRADE